MIAETLVTHRTSRRTRSIGDLQKSFCTGPAHNSGVQQRKVRRQRVVRQSVPVRVGERGSRFAERLCIALYEQFKTALYPGTRDVETGGTVGYFAQERSGIGIAFDRPDVASTVKADIADDHTQLIGGDFLWRCPRPTCVCASASCITGTTRAASRS